MSLIDVVSGIEDLCKFHFIVVVFFCSYIYML